MEDIKKDVQIHIDYLAFTFPLKSEIDVKFAFEEIKEELANIFYMTSFNYGPLNDWGQDNYRHQLSLGQNIVVRFGGEMTMMKEVIDREMSLKSAEKVESCMVELKGQACREIEVLSGGNVDYINIIKWFFAQGGKCTRIDLAIDDCGGDIITLDEVIKIVGKGLYTSSFRSTPELICGAVDGIDDKGSSLYFGKSQGKRKNNLELCIYDKKCERKFNNDSFSGEYWTRYELRFRADGAENLSYFIANTKLENIGLFACEQLKRILTLKCKRYKGKKTDMKDVRKLDVHPKWDKFLKGVKGTKFSMLQKMETTIEKKLSWRSYSLCRQNILLDFADAYNGSDWVEPIFGKVYTEMNEMLNFLKEKKYKIQQKDIEMINNFIRKEKDDPFFVPLEKKDLDNYMYELERRILKFEKRYRLPF